MLGIRLPDESRREFRQKVMAAILQMFGLVNQVHTVCPYASIFCYALMPSSWSEMKWCLDYLVVSVKELQLARLWLVAELLIAGIALLEV